MYDICIQEVFHELPELLTFHYHIIYLFVLKNTSIPVHLFQLHYKT